MQSQAIAVEHTFSHFFHNVSALIRETHARSEQHWAAPEKDLQQKLEQTQVAVHAALSDDFDTPTVMRLLQDLIAQSNSYINQREPQLRRSAVLRSVATFVTYILRVLLSSCSLI